MSHPESDHYHPSLIFEQESRILFFSGKAGSRTPLSLSTPAELLRMAKRRRDTTVDLTFWDENDGWIKQRIPVEDARWMRLQQQLLTSSNSSFMLGLAQEYGVEMGVGGVVGNASIATWSTVIQACQERGLTIDHAETLVAGFFADIQYENTPFGTSAETTYF